MLAEIAQIFHLLIMKPIFLAQDRCYRQIRATNSFFLSAYCDFHGTLHRTIPTGLNACA